MLKFDKEQRTLLADKIGDAANLTFGALVVGQALSDRPFSASGMAAGVVFWAVGVGVAIRIRRGGP